jgi:formate hydrogenlyase subunit 3/multisubunit Na+/H+ antiporter MnhD subunit
MNASDISGLAEDIAISFGLPLFLICVLLVNIKLWPGNKSTGLKVRLAIIYAIALFGFLIFPLMFQDRYILAAIWRRDPVLFSVVYMASVILIAGGIISLVYWKLRPQLWRRNDSD